MHLRTKVGPLFPVRPEATTWSLQMKLTRVSFNVMWQKFQELMVIFEPLDQYLLMFVLWPPQSHQQDKNSCFEYS